jgi:hypothetical protein
MALLMLFVGMAVQAQAPADGSDYAVESFDDTQLTGDDLQTLVGPIALYPDDLLAIVLPASTYPLQIVQAARFLEAYEIDSSLEPDEDWDESVIALINYPEVIELLNDDIDWTWRLGEAVISQQEDVVSAVEVFRDRAYVAGNLKSDEYQTVSRDDDIIEIVPIEDDVIYVPYYEPEVVVVRQPRPVYHYYAQPYPVYYYPYPYGHAFTSGYFWGVTTAFRIGWATDHLRVHHASYWGHPYYGHHYYGHYYRRPSITVYNTVYVNNARRHSQHSYRDGDYWRPHRRSGARQSDYSMHTRHYRNDVERVRNSVTRSTSGSIRTAFNSTAHRTTDRSTRTRTESTQQGATRQHTANRRQTERRQAPREDVRQANRSTSQQRTRETRQQPVSVARQQPTRVVRQQAERVERQQHQARAMRQQSTRAEPQQQARATRQQPAPATRQQPARAERQQPARATRQQPAQAERQQPARAERQQSTRASDHGQSERKSSRGQSERRERRTR